MRCTRHALLTAALLTSGAAAAAPGTPPPVSAPSLVPIGAVSASQTVEFDIILPLSNPAGLDALIAQQQDPTSSQYHKWLKPSDFAARFGASQQIVSMVTAALQYFGMQVTPQSRSLHVTGTAAQVNQAFNVSLALAQTQLGQTTVVANRKPSLPPALASVGALISAFSPSGFQAAPMMHRAAGGYFHSSAWGYFHSSAWGYFLSSALGYAGGAALPPGYFYSDLKQAYDYPSYQTVVGQGHGTRLDGTGATVAVVMSSDVQDSDVAMLFDNMNFRANSGQKADPAVLTRRTVNGGAPFSPTSPAAEEATADVEQVLGGAPGANLVLYDTPDLGDQSLISAYTAIVNDNVADVVSMSYGQCELNYTAAYNNGIDQTLVLNIFSELFKQGNAQGITFVAATGDAGGLGCASTGYYAGQGGKMIAGVGVPAADPDVTAVGGTNLVIAADRGGADSSYVGENAWADPEVPIDPAGMGTKLAGGGGGSGGGVSTIYPKPSWQGLVTTGSSSWRTLPDTAMQMGGCPDVAQLPCDGGMLDLDGSGNADRSSLNVVFDGQLDNVVGTSLAAPEFASVVALMVEAQGRQGNLNPTLYTLAQRQASGGAHYFHAGVGGWDGVVASGTGYNWTTGVGTPDVAVLLGLSSAARAGSPQSASNP